MEDGIIKEGSFNVERGVGVRAISGEKTGFAYSDEISQDAILKACGAARSIAPQGGTLKVAALSDVATTSRYASDNPIQAMAEAEKLPCSKPSMPIFVNKTPTLARSLSR